ncbi:transposase [Hydrogenibacillus schlegelii]
MIAARYARTKERHGYRNGTVSRTLTTRVVRLVFRVAWVRNVLFSTEMFARYQLREKALIIALM